MFSLRERQRIGQLSLRASVPNLPDERRLHLLVPYIPAGNSHLVFCCDGRSARTARRGRSHARSSCRRRFSFSSILSATIDMNFSIICPISSSGSTLNPAARGGARTPRSRQVSTKSATSAVDRPSRSSFAATTFPASPPRRDRGSRLPVAGRRSSPPHVRVDVLVGRSVVFADRPCFARRGSWSLVETRA